MAAKAAEGQLSESPSAQSCTLSHHPPLSQPVRDVQGFNYMNACNGCFTKPPWISPPTICVPVWLAAISLQLFISRPCPGSPCPFSALLTRLEVQGALPVLEQTLPGNKYHSQPP